MSRPITRLALAAAAVLPLAACADRELTTPPTARSAPVAPRFTTTPTPDLYAYVTNEGDGTVSVIRTSDNTIIATVGVGVTPVNAAVTPDGSFVYVTNLGGTISVIRTSDNTVATSVGRQPSGIAITSAPITVVDPAQEVSDLQTTVSGLPNLGSGLSTSLQTKLNSALAAIVAGDTAAACAALQDFINEVNAQSGKKISTSAAASLIEQANAIRTQLGC